MLVDPIKADLKLSDFQMSLALGPAFAVVYAIAGLPLGWLADRYSRRWVVFRQRHTLHNRHGRCRRVAILFPPAVR
jgi:MFS family permease